MRAGAGSCRASRSRAEHNPRPVWNHVFVEPHFDDVALSCGGTVHALASRGERVLVVTVFAGNPGVGTRVTDFAAGQHARWGDALDPIAARLAEQEAAMAVLGADWRGLG